MAPILIALWQWGEDFCFDENAPSYRCVELKTQRPLALIEVCYEDGEKVDIRDFGFIGVRGNAPGGGDSGVGVAKAKPTVRTVSDAETAI